MVTFKNSTKSASLLVAGTVILAGCFKYNTWSKSDIISSVACLVYATWCIKDGIEYLGKYLKEVLNDKEA